MDTGDDYAIYGDETLPQYTAIDHLDDQSVVQQYKDGLGDENLPITHYPVASVEKGSLDPYLLTLIEQILSTYFTAIRSKNDAVIYLFISSGLVGPDTTDQSGETPLLAAVSAGDRRTVQRLIDLGATVDMYGQSCNTSRTPLQLAAATGNLAIVKFLMEHHGADDSLIAPDGQLALRLAAEAGHREVVAYLPERRGGGWRRWKTHHAKSVAVARKAARRIWWFFRILGKCVYLPLKGLLWELPKWVFKEAHRFPGWARKQVAKGPERARRLAAQLKKTPARLARVGRWTLREVKKTPDRLRRMAIEVKQVSKQIVLSIWRALEGIAKAIWSIVAKTISLIHSTLHAIWTRLRAVTMQDLLNGLRTVFLAIFVDLPKSIGKFLMGFVKGAVDLIGAIGRGFGKALVWIVKNLTKLILATIFYVPAQLWKMVVAMFSSLMKAYHEVRVWISPKYRASI